MFEALLYCEIHVSSKSQLFTNSVIIYASANPGGIFHSLFSLRIQRILSSHKGTGHYISY